MSIPRYMMNHWSHWVEHLQSYDVTTLEADSVQTIRSLEDHIATLARRDNNAVSFNEHSVDAHVKFLSLSSALEEEQVKNEVLTVCNAQLTDLLAKGADERQPVQLEINVAAAAGASSSNSDKRKRDDDDDAYAREQLRKTSTELAMERLTNKKVRKDNESLKSAFEDLVESAHCLLASIEQQNDDVHKNGLAFEKTLNRVLKQRSSKQ
jgi:hypothetical protein